MRLAEPHVLSDCQFDTFCDRGCGISICGGKRRLTLASARRFYAHFWRETTFLWKGSSLLMIWMYFGTNHVICIPHISKTSGKESRKQISIFFSQPVFGLRPLAFSSFHPWWRAFGIWLATRSGCSWVLNYVAWRASGLALGVCQQTHTHQKSPEFPHRLVSRTLNNNEVSTIHKLLLLLFSGCYKPSNIDCCVCAFATWQANNAEGDNWWNIVRLHQVGRPIVCAGSSTRKPSSWGLQMIAKLVLAFK